MQYSEFKKNASGALTWVAVSPDTGRVRGRIWKEVKIGARKKATQAPVSYDTARVIRHGPCHTKWPVSS